MNRLSTFCLALVFGVLALDLAGRTFWSIPILREACATGLECSRKGVAFALLVLIATFFFWVFLLLARRTLRV